MKKYLKYNKFSVTIPPQNTIRKGEIHMVREILLGNKKSNIIEKLKKSGTVRVLLIISYFYLYEVYKKAEGMEVKDILWIGILGLFIVNLLYIPVRLLWSKKVSFESKLVFTLATVIGISYCSTVATEISLYGVYGKAISIIASSLAVTFMIGALMKKLEVHFQKMWKVSNSLK